MDNRERLIALQLEHETSYHEAAGTWEWSCKCGLTATFIAWDDCHKRTREHWADVVLGWCAQVALEARAAIEGEGRDPRKLAERWRKQAKKQWDEGDNGQSIQSEQCAADLEHWLDEDAPAKCDQEQPVDALNEIAICDRHIVAFGARENCVACRAERVLEAPPREAAKHTKYRLVDAGKLTGHWECECGADLGDAPIDEIHEIALEHARAAAPLPTAPQPTLSEGELRGLVAKWRKFGESSWKRCAFSESNAIEGASRQQAKDCADELERVLAAGQGKV